MTLKKITFIIAFAFLSFASYGQNRKGDFRLEKGSSSHQLYVSIEEYAGINSISNDVGFRMLQEEYGFVLQQGVMIPEEKLQELERNAIALTGSGNSVSKLRNIFTVSFPNPTNDRVLELAEKLEQLQTVEYCSLVSLEPIKPAADIPPATSNFENLQTYIGPNPGLNMTYAWNLGLSGTGINIRDVEYGFNKNHEELNDVNAFIAAGMTVSSAASTSYTEHGTAVIGILFSHKGTYGTSGLAHGANEVLLFPEWQQTGYNRNNAITQSIANSSMGDVILFEMQATGAQGGYGPAEYESVAWDLTKAATDAGIIIVAAAGNGAENLDSDPYLSYRNRGDSGAIIVGAGTSTISHNRIAYSTYGTRVDVQAWGQDVLAPGYGDAYQIGGDFNQYYTNFSGTSSATPLVASCAIVLQSYYYGLTGNYMTGIQMRNLLKITGIAQGSGVAGNIGPIPNMETAILQIQSDFLNVKDDKFALEFIVYPNPVRNEITIKTEDLSENAKAEIYNFLGQLIYSKPISQEALIDLSSYPQGVYTIKVIDNGKSEVKKIIKK